MNVKITKGKLSGTIDAICSKSQAHRYLIAAALSDKVTTIKCKTLSADITATANCLNAMGADISYNDDTFTVVPISTVPKTAEIDCGESGSTLRFILPIVCALGINTTIKMSGKLPQRPLTPMWEELIINGVSLSKNEDRIITNGKLKAGKYNIQGNISSQFITGLLLALPLVQGESKINIIGNLESVDYVKMTEEVLKNFGVDFSFVENSYIIKSNSDYKSPENVIIEGDWSNIAFWLTAGILSDTEIICKGLDIKSPQGDKQICNIIKAFGGNIEIENNTVKTSNSVTNGVVIDCSDIPDLVPAIAPIAAISKGTTKFINAQRLRLKESDRLFTVCDTLSKLGADIKETDDGLIVVGKEKLNGGTINSHNDHRIAMMGAIMSAKCEGPVIITDAKAVNKSYPEFFEDFKKLGGELEVI